MKCTIQSSLFLKIWPFPILATLLLFFYLKNNFCFYTYLLIQPILLGTDVNKFNDLTRLDSAPVPRGGPGGPGPPPGGPPPAASGGGPIEQNDIKIGDSVKDSSKNRNFSGALRAHY